MSKKVYLCKSKKKQIMALYLSAEQQNLKDVFINDKRYIIPAYQRHYSWTYEQCRQLYDDISIAYINNTSYFIGNIVLAEGEDKDLPEVVDGQQRLITLWLYLKAFSILLPNKTKIGRMLRIDPWDENDGDDNESKIFSKVFEVKDQNQITSILNFTREKYEEQNELYIKKREDKYIRENPGQLQANAVAIYGMLKEAFERMCDENQHDFFNYFVENVFLLPIVLTDNDINQARSHALTVFETINNRGMDLQDADIFKARLYDMSIRAEKSEFFIEQWTALTSDCLEMDVKIDDLFRYYYHIIRGQNGIITAEKGLRDFYQNDPASPFKKGGFDHVLDSLKKILQILKTCKTLKDGEDSLSSWLNILYAYTNQYPQIALVSYLFFKQDYKDDTLSDFVKNIVRFCYYKGSTTSVKFKIYEIINAIAHDKPIEDFAFNEVGSDMWNYPGRLKEGLAQLVFHLQNPEHASLRAYSVDRIIRSVETPMLGDGWSETDKEMLLNSLANYIVIDMPRRYTSIEQRVDRFASSSISELRTLTIENICSRKWFVDRLKRIEETLTQFFIGR